MRFDRDVELAERFLRAARVGTRVATFCGFGGDMPAGYKLVGETKTDGLLELWEKRADERGAVAARPPLATAVFAARRAIVWDSED